MQLEGLSGSGQSPAAKRHLVLFWSENTLSGKVLKGCCYCQQIVPSHFRVRLIHQRKISLSLTLSYLAIGRSKFSPLLILNQTVNVRFFV